MSTPKTYKLHELIEMAKAGKKFRAYRIINSVHSEGWFLFGQWTEEAILADWSLVREPEVVEFEAEVRQIDHAVYTGIPTVQKLKGKRWKFVATEVVE